MQTQDSLTESQGSGSLWNNPATVRVAALALLFVGVFWPNLWRLWTKTNPFYGEANWQHSIFVPLLGIYYLYVSREEMFEPAPARVSSRKVRLLSIFLVLGLAGLFASLGCLVVSQASLAAALVVVSLASFGLAGWVGRRAIEAQQGSRDGAGALARVAGWFGATLAIFGLLAYGYAIYPGQNDFAKDVAMVIALFGIATLVGGWQVMRVAWFPILFLVVAIPWSPLMYSMVAGPLQKMAASVAVATLRVTGVMAINEGTKIVMGEGDRIRTLNVAEACAGMRSLMTFTAVGAAVAFLSARPLWQRLLLTASSVPIAIFCNVLRVSGQGLLDHYVSAKLSESFAHEFVGLVMLIPAFFMILGVGRFLDRLFVEEVEDRAQVYTVAAGQVQHQAPTDSTAEAAREAMAESARMLAQRRDRERK